MTRKESEMLKKIRLYIRSKFHFWFADLVCSHVVVGARCGLCGKWVANCLVDSMWRYTVCQDCIDGE